MKIVVDSNHLQSESLQRYLDKSPTNKAVLTDYAAIEAHQGNTLASIYKSMAILSDFPSQVLILKPTRAVCGLRGRTAGLQKRLIDERASKAFPKYIVELRQAQDGNAAFQRRLLELGKEATNHLHRMLIDAESAAHTIDEFAPLYSKDERRAVRHAQAYTPEMVRKTVKIILGIADRLFRTHPSTHNRPTFAELPNTFVFRVALCTYLLVLDWASVGGAKDASPAKLRNDFVDMHFVAYATYFDGLMTADSKASRLHTEARLWLSALFDCDISKQIVVR